MDRKWMWFDRLSKAYEDGVEEFLLFAKAHIQDDKIPYPCQICGNHRSHSIDDVRGYLRTYGIICSY